MECNLPSEYYFGIIVLNWNAYHDTKKCIDSIFKTSDCLFKLIVVDNASTDGSGELIKQYLKHVYPESIYISSSDNLGYCGGNNIGIEQSIKMGLKYTFILNNDVFFDGCNILSSIRNAMRNTNVAVVSPLVNSVAPNNGRFFKILDLLFNLNVSKDEHFQYASYVCGCAIAFKNEFLISCSGFHNDFFMYNEEVDICYRARRAGYMVVQLLNLDSNVIRKNDSEEKKNRPYVWYYQTRNMLLFIKRTNISLVRKTSAIILFLMISLLRPIHQSRLSNFSPIFLGFIHGLKNISGKYDF